MYSELRKVLEKEVCTSDCKSKLDYERQLLKALMRDLGIGTLFVSYNNYLGEIQAFSSCANCADELVCLCDECMTNDD